MDGNTAPEASFDREGLVVTAALGSITLLAWVYTAHLAWNGMGGMTTGLAQPQLHPWSVRDVALLFIMWTVMMVAMMVPSASPMVLLFASVHRQRREQDGSYVPTGVFLLGYVVVWGAFSAVVALAQWGLHQAALLSPMMMVTAPWLGAVLLIGAGVFQFMPLKDACLARCRTPLGFLMTEWREGAWGAFIMGVRHGGYCTGCCWALMALLFVGGVMNLLWVAVLTVFVLVEKVAPAGRWLGKVGGMVLIAWGAWGVVAIFS